jgi:uncharacterized protein (DUF488 family)
MLRTVGHGTVAAGDLADRLIGAGVRTLVDIRTIPASRRHPQFGRDAMTQWLAPYGIAYRWEPRLGGLRKPPPGSPDGALRNDAFRGYAAWMRAPEFVTAIDEVLRLDDAAVMCAESVWWKCHRRMVADFVTLARRVDVRHLMPDGRQAPHRPTDGVRLRGDGLLVYDAGDQLTLA